MGARIAVVDDNDENLRFVTFLVRALGHEALPAASAQDALDLLRRERPDLILLDIQMPGMDGFDVLRHLRRDSGLAGVPVVAVTALAMVGDREAALRSGFDGYITKPIEPATFPSFIDDFLPADRRSKTVQKEA